MTTKTNKTTTHTTSYRIIAESPIDGEEVVLFTERSIIALARRIQRDTAKWESRGYEQWRLEDNSLGRGNWTPTLREHLTAMHQTGQIDYPTWKELRHYTW